MLLVGPDGEVKWADEPTSVEPLSAARIRDLLKEATLSWGEEGFGPHSVRKGEQSTLIIFCSLRPEYIFLTISTLPPLLQRTQGECLTSAMEI